jgi:hypothetical protein
MAQWELVAWVKWGFSALALLAVGCGDYPVLQMRQYSTVDGTERLNGSGCVGTQKGEQTGAGAGVAPGASTPGPAFSYEYDGTGDGIQFIVRDGAGAELANHYYDADFLNSGKRDEIDVTPGGVPVRFVHWGEKACDGSSSEPPP